MAFSHLGVNVVRTNYSDANSTLYKKKSDWLTNNPASLPRGVSPPVDALTSVCPFLKSRLTIQTKIWSQKIPGPVFQMQTHNPSTDMDSRPAKKRLSMACNTCRIRKVKCDTDYPRCRNCRLRDEECVTSDPRRPGESVVREWIESEKIVKGAPKSGLYSSPSSQQQTIDKPGPTIVAERPEVLFPVQEHGYEAHPRSNQHIDSNLHESPVHQPFHVSLNTDTEHNRTKIVGGSSSQCLAKSLDVYLKAVHQKPISGFFKYGMRHAEELDIPLGTSLPQLPDTLLRKEYISTFLDRIHSVYPLFDEDTLRQMVDQLGELKDGIRCISKDQTPWLASVYLALSIGADEKARETTIDGTRYLQAAASLLGHVVLVPYFPAVQSLLMYTIVYRGRNKEGLAWQTLGMAIRIAYTIGIHRRAAYSAPRAEDTPYVKKYTLERRVWAVCCILEKCMQFESGRPSAIPYSITSDDILPSHIHRHHSYGDLLQWQLELAVYQDQISEHIYGHTLRKRAAREILLDTARLDKCLLEWVNQIPSQIRPGNDIFCPRETFHCAALLSILYHEAMITLHRAAVIAPNVNFEIEVEKHGPDDASRFRILGGESICINSARAIAKLNIELSDQKTNTRLLTTGVPLLACIVLAIYLIKHPESRMQSSDLQVGPCALRLYD